MRERPILFSAPMVRAILYGRKTQTRRVCKGQRELSNVRDFQIDRCPYGQPGDRLWVRETWAAVHFSIDPETGIADDWHGSHDIPPGDGGGYWSKLYAADNHPTDKEERGFSWRPSIHMPRWASRITLEITAVRVERLQDISEEDAIAEGPPGLQFPAPPGSFWVTDDGRRKAFRSLWESINGTESWEQNPWVWVIEFKRLEAGNEN